MSDEEEKDGATQPAAAAEDIEAPAGGFPADHISAADTGPGDIGVDPRMLPAVRGQLHAALRNLGGTYVRSDLGSFVRDVKPTAAGPSPFLTNVMTPSQREAFESRVGPAIRSSSAIETLSKSLESAQLSSFKAIRARGILDISVSRNMVPAMPALAELAKTMESVRGPLLTTHGDLGEKLAGIRRFAQGWQSTVGPSSSGLVAAMRQLEAVRAPLLNVNRVFEEVAGFSRGWAATAGVFKSDAMREMTATLWSGVDHSGFVDRVMRGHTDALVGTLQRWSSWADRGVLAARIALETALDARAAAKDGDLEPVKQFMRQFLGFRKLSMDLVASAVLVLLDASRWLSDAVLTLQLNPAPLLRKLTLAEHREQGLILDPRPDRRVLRLGGQSLLALDQPIGSQDEPDQEIVTLGDAQTSDQHPNPAVAYEQRQITDPRLLRVLECLTDGELDIAYERGRPGTSWPAAAAARGATREEGEALRRKVKRLVSK